MSVTASTIPRFLLPRLSWGPAPLSLTTTLPRASAACAGMTAWRMTPRRTLHAGPVTDGATRPRATTPTKRCGCGARETNNGSIHLGSIARNPTLRQSFHASAARRRDHHFDTLRFVQRLQQEGFTEEQSVAMMRVLNDVIEESIQNLTRTMVPREEAAKTTYTQKVDFAKLRSELLSADSTESTATRAAHERLANDIAKLSGRLRDEISRTQASVRLDLNLEKGRIREEAVSQELKIKETETKIEQEAAALRQQLEQVKFQTLQWLIGVCTGFAALLLGAWRLLM
ncbi:hypothetical protein VTJ83DRAFT_2450 [Remersonia thermophila]|uniref:DUF1640 domain-containing protein n=1 Tax=Remersonia thermophila TaxID=72144 RepID=A0ABR4DIZ6_9PEZI